MDIPKQFEQLADIDRFCATRDRCHYLQATHHEVLQQLALRAKSVCFYWRLGDHARVGRELRVLDVMLSRFIGSVVEDGKAAFEFGDIMEHLDEIESPMARVIILTEVFLQILALVLPRP